MVAKVRMLLGILFDYDLVEVDQWCCQPGIDLALSGRIVGERHKNDAFNALEGLLRLPRIEPRRLTVLKRYF